MGKMETTLHGDLNHLAEKITWGMFANCPRLLKRDEWETTVGDVTCKVIVFEQYAEKMGGQHASLALTLVKTPEEIRLCAINSGTSNAPHFIPYDGGEFELMMHLGTTLETLDSMPW